MALSPLNSSSLEQLALKGFNGSWEFHTLHVFAVRLYGITQFIHAAEIFVC